MTSAKARPVQPPRRSSLPRMGLRLPKPTRTWSKLNAANWRGNAATQKSKPRPMASSAVAAHASAASRQDRLSQCSASLPTAKWNLMPKSLRPISSKSKPGRRCASRSGNNQSIQSGSHNDIGVRMRPLQGVFWGLLALQFWVAIFRRISLLHKQVSAVFATRDGQPPICSTTALLDRYLGTQQGSSARSIPSS